MNAWTQGNSTSMIKRLHRRLQKVHPGLPVYLAAMALMAVCGGIAENTYNNYLYSEFHLLPTTRGNLELIREFPGLLSAVMVGGLIFLSETRIAAVAAVITAVGVAGLGAWGANWWLMLMWTLLWSAGSHLLMPVSSSLTMGFGGEDQRGKRLGQVGAISTVGSIAGAAVVWGVFGHTGVPKEPALALGSAPEQWRFSLTFYLAAAACVAAAFMFARLRNMGIHGERPRMSFKRKYWLYYVLNILWGARKQVFLTFGRWVLVTVFQQPPTAFAKLWIVASVLGVGFNPLVGRLVDRVGERALLVADAALTVLVCLGYAAAKHLGLSDSMALVIVFICFIGDQTIMALGMARDTYLSKISDSKEDLSANLSLGVSINHVISMSVPALGGLLWKAHGYEIVFLVAAGLAAVQGVFAALVRVPQRIPVPEASA
jgi:MFS family permease